MKWIKNGFPVILFVLAVFITNTYLISSEDSSLNASSVIELEELSPEQVDSNQFMQKTISYTSIAFISHLINLYTETYIHIEPTYSCFNKTANYIRQCNDKSPPTL